MSTFHVYAVGSLTSLPFRAFTANECDPCASPLYALGLVQLVYAALSRLHWKLAPPGPEKTKVADVEPLFAAGADVMAGAARPALEAATVAPVTRPTTATRAATRTSARRLVVVTALIGCP